MCSNYTFNTPRNLCQVLKETHNGFLLLILMKYVIRGGDQISKFRINQERNIGFLYNFLYKRKQTYLVSGRERRAQLITVSNFTSCLGRKIFNPLRTHLNNTATTNVDSTCSYTILSGFYLLLLN